MAYTKRALGQRANAKADVQEGLRPLYPPKGKDPGRGRMSPSSRVLFACANGYLVRTPSAHCKQIKGRESLVFRALCARFLTESVPFCQRGKP